MLLITTDQSFPIAAWVGIRVYLCASVVTSSGGLRRQARSQLPIALIEWAPEH